VTKKSELVMFLTPTIFFDDMDFARDIKKVDKSKKDLKINDD